MRAYLEELDLPRGDVHFDEARLRRLAVEALGSLSDEELAGRAGVEPRLGPALRGARDLVEARAIAAQLTERAAAAADELPRDAASASASSAGQRQRTSTRTPPRRSSASSRRSGATCARSASRSPAPSAARSSGLSSSPCRERRLWLGPAELRLHLPERGEERLGGASRGAAVAPPHRDDLAAERLGVLDLDAAEEARLELVRDRREGMSATPKPSCTIFLAASMLSSSMTPSGRTPAPRKTAFVSSE